MIATPAPPASPPATAPRSADIAKLRRFLDRVRRRARRWIWFEAVSLVALALAGWFWATLLLDWLIEPPAGVRMLALGGLAVWLAVLVSRQLIGRLQTRLGDGPLALLVERTHPELNDSLSTAIELDPRASTPATPLDPALLAQTTALAAATVSRVEFGRLFRRRRLLRLAGAAGLALGTVVAVLVLVPVIRENWLRRMVLFSEAPWPRRVTLVVEGFPGGIRRVARGSDVEVVVTARAAGDPPQVVELRTRGSAGWSSQRMGTRGGPTADGQRFAHTLPAVTEDVILEIRGGDGRLRGLRIEAIEPPRLKQLELTVTPPDYIGGGPRSLSASRLVEVPAGATVSLTATASKELATAEMLELPAAPTAGAETVADGRPAPRIIARLEAGSSPGDPAGSRRGRGPAGQQRLTGVVGPVLTDALIEISFTDTDGISSQQPIRFQLLARPDEPPRLEVTLDGISTAVTPAAVIPLVGLIEDDHGLAAAAVALRRAAADQPAAAEESARTAPTAHSRPIELPERSTTRLELQGDLAPTVAVATVEATVGDRLELTVSARDSCGLASGNQQSVTEPWSLRVVTPEALVAMLEAREVILRRRFESLLADMQQTRDRVATAEPDPAAGTLAAARLGEAAARAGGETGEIAKTFRQIARELFNNSLLNAELEGRLLGQIAGPLEQIVAGPIDRLAVACRPVAGDTPDPARLIGLTDACLSQMRAVLDKMIELETFNEVVDSLRKLIEQQEAIRRETDQQRKQRAREALKGL